MVQRQAMERSRHSFGIFILLAAVIFLALQQSYLRFRAVHEDRINDGLNGRPSAALINLLTPGWQVSSVDGRLAGRRASIEIRKGCEGVEVMILLAAVLLAYPMAWRRKLAGLLFGCLLIYAVNLIRIVSLYYLSVLRPGWFSLFHVAVWQAVIVLAGWLFFMFWIRREPGAG